MAAKQKLAALQRERIEVNVNGMAFFVRDISGAERVDYDRFVFSQLNDEGRVTSGTAIEAKLVQLSLEDEDGAKVYGKNDYDAVLQLPSGILSHVYQAVAQVCGLYREPNPADESHEEPQEDAQLVGLDGKNG